MAAAWQVVAEFLVFYVQRVCAVQVCCVGNQNLWIESLTTWIFKILHNSSIIQLSIVDLYACSRSLSLSARLSTPFPSTTAGMFTKYLMWYTRTLLSYFRRHLCLGFVLQCEICRQFLETCAFVLFSFIRNRRKSAKTINSPLLLTTPRTEYTKS